MDWLLGFVADPLPGHEKATGRLSIPYVTPAGVVAMKFRCIEDHTCDGHQKYDAERGQKLYLYGVQNFQLDADTIYICEGEIDALSATAAGFPAVGVPGATNWRSWWRYCFEGYNDVVVLIDGDVKTLPGKDYTPGELLGRNAANAIYNARVVPMPPGEDVNSFLLKEGPEALRRRVDGHGGTAA